MEIIGLKIPITEINNLLNGFNDGGHKLEDRTIAATHFEQQREKID